MTTLPRTAATPPFQRLLIASALALTLAACGGGSDSSSAATPPPVVQPVTPPVVDPVAPALPELVSSQTFTAPAKATAGSSDASTAFALPDGFMLVADDEANVLRVYPRAGGAAVLEWSYALYGPTLGKELDLEAATRIGDTYYFTGSNSNKKDGDDAMAERSHLFAVKIKGTGASTTFDYVGQFSALETQLVAWDVNNTHGRGANHFGFAVSAAAGIVPERVDGFSIEGMTSAPGDSALWLGFRAPLTDKGSRTKALIVPVQNAPALLAGTAAQASFGAPIELELGGRGIRSIDKGTDGRYLIVAGPPGASSALVDRNFALFAWDGNANSAPVELSNDLEALRKATGGSFETIVDVPGPVAAGTEVQLLMDNGDTVWDPATGVVSKDLPATEQKFGGFVVRLGAPRVDTAGPQLRRTTPADDRIGVNRDASIVLSFNQAVRLGSGSLALRKADGSVVETFSAASPAARVQRNFNVLTLVPSQALEADTDYHLTVEGNAITDTAGHAFAGFNDATTLNFRSAGQPTPLAIGDMLFVGANAEAPDAFAFVLLKAVNGGTKITFTDRDRKSGVDEFSGLTKETAFVWTADRNLPAGSIVTVQTDVVGSPIADLGFTIGAPGGLGKEETIYAFTGGTIKGLGEGVAGEISAVGPYLASITLGGTKDNTIPDVLTQAGTAFSFVVSPTNQTSAIYTGSMDRTDIARFAARVKFADNWNRRYKPALGYPLLANDSLFGEQRLP
ncbi:Ig-like domain-containing protein [Variovorax sp. LT1R16]|uniref:Ig-like domain-containing protein n=1 Tax=Variovorax sp. LT1R16 TaxID=3443728 RepID=UPI003F45E9F0